ncbi:hypothetical protein [Paenibacillus macerans]|uniref:hypothetical protein n=1 Tax=Paenibacillus macerans TaxID=44252 RepID=UPI003D31BE92
MTKHIQAYFNTEDQVEGARLSLLPFEVEQVEAGHTVNELGVDDRIQVPLLPVNNGMISAAGSNSPGVVPLPGTARGAQSVLPVMALGDRNADDALNGERSEAVSGERPMESTSEPIDTGDAPEGGKYVLSARVKDSDYEHVVQKLREQGAYIPVQ